MCSGLLRRRGNRRAGQNKRLRWLSWARGFWLYRNVPFYHWRGVSTAFRCINRLRGFRLSCFAFRFQPTCFKLCLALQQCLAFGKHGLHIRLWAFGTFRCSFRRHSLRRLGCRRNRPAPLATLEFWLLAHVSPMWCDIVNFRFRWRGPTAPDKVKKPFWQEYVRFEGIVHHIPGIRTQRGLPCQSPLQ